MIDYKKINFKSYSNKQDSLSLEDMQNIHEQILFNAKENNDFNEIWTEIILDSINYFNIRSNWNLLSKVEQQDKNFSRTTIHNSIIDNFIVLERIFKRNSWNSESWTKKLFLTNNRTKNELNKHRKRIGDFSNYLAFIYAINAR